MGLAPEILQALEAMGFDTPTDVQAKGIPHIMNNEDLIVISKTGSGKTAVFGVSMLHMIDPEAEGPQGLILTPTRELAVQVDSDLCQMSQFLAHKTTAVYGQHNINAEIKTINEGVSVITGTPGRVYDHIRHGKMSTKNIRFLVLDEADRMLDMGFLDQVVKIIRTLPKNRVTLLFSATMPPEVLRICKEYMKNPVTIEIESPTKTVDTIQQEYCRVDRSKKNTELHRILMVEQPESCMVFCNTKIAVDRVCSFLSRRGHSCQPLHGDIPQSKRMTTIQQFKQGEFHILVATDVAARGIHIDVLSLVINYDVPVERDSYVHRIGRTGRIGNTGKALTLVTSDDIMSLYDIEEHIGAMIRETEPPTDDEVRASRAAAEKWMAKGRHMDLNEREPERHPRESGRFSREPGRTARESGRAKPNENKAVAAPVAAPPADGKKPARKRRRRKPAGSKPLNEAAIGQTGKDTGREGAASRNERPRDSKPHVDRPAAAPGHQTAHAPSQERQKSETKGSLVSRMLKRIIGK